MLFSSQKDDAEDLFFQGLKLGDLFRERIDLRFVSLFDEDHVRALIQCFYRTGFGKDVAGVGDLPVQSFFQGLQGRILFFDGADQAVACGTFAGAEFSSF